MCNERVTMNWSERAAMMERLEARHLLCGIHPGFADLGAPLATGSDAAFVARVNFGPDQTRAVPGYTRDTGDVYGASAAGWTSGELNDGKVRRSDRASDDRYDSFLFTPAGSTWELAVPDGLYTVRLAAGDAKGVGRALSFSVEGVSALHGETSRQQRWLESTLTVSVVDGRLTIQAERDGILNFVDVLSAESEVVSNKSTFSTAGARLLTGANASTFSSSFSASTTRRINFQPAGAATVSGYAVDAGQTYGARAAGTYGWTVAHNNAIVDRNLNSNQLLDTNVGVIASSRWELAVPNGQYTVSVSVGDAARSSSNNVWIEGRQLFNYVPLAKNQFRRGSITVSVSDGRLTLGVGSASTGATRLNYIDVVPAASSPSPPPSTTTFPTSVSWTTVTPNPVSRAEAVGNIVNGKLYVMGGLDGKVAGTTATYAATRRGDYYDYTTNRWTRVADMPEAFSHATGVVVGDRIWFVGGYLGNQPGPATTRVWIYDTSDNKWSRGPDLPLARGAGGAALIGSTIYFVGGMDRDRIFDRGNMWALDLNQQSKGWVAKASMPTARNHLAVLAAGGKLYAISGQRDEVEDQIAMKQLEVYDPATNSWFRKADLPAPRSHITSSVFLYKGRIVVLAGEHGFNTTSRELYAFNPATNSWSLMGMLPAPRSTMVAGVLPDGRIVTSTGNSPSFSATTWIGRPA